MNKRILTIALFMLASSCVSKSKHEALQAQYDTDTTSLKSERDSTSEKLADTGRKLAQSEESLRQEQLNVQKLNAHIKKLEERLALNMKDRTQLQSSVDEMRVALQELSRRKAEADSRIAEFQSLLSKFKTLIDAGKLRVKIVDGRMVVELATDVLFSSGSARLSKEGQEAIAEVARTLQTIPGRKFQIEGHTDNVPIRTAAFPSNWELASARAITVLRTMVDAGMPEYLISAASYADSKPALSNETREGKAANRRIEIVVVPDLSSLPGFDELQKLGGGK